MYERERYNHIGDITWDQRERGGRILRRSSATSPSSATPARPARSASPIRITLQWRYYVKLDPAFIDKAMWAEASPDGKLLWTSNGALNGGHDLLAYDMKEIKAGERGPRRPPP